MDGARDTLDGCGRDLAALLSALDSGADPAQLLALAEKARASFDAASRLLPECAATDGEDAAAALANLRRWTAFAADSVRSSQARTGERLHTVTRVRQALSRPEPGQSGGSCDVAG